MGAEDDAGAECVHPDRTAGLVAAALGTLGDNPKVHELLDRQIALADLQIEDLHNELKLRHWSLRFANLSAVLKVSFEVAMAIIATTIAILLCYAIWSATNDDGLVIDSFSVPPDLAQKGLTGEVAATRLLDRLTEFQNKTYTLHAGARARGDWGKDIKVEIPETGISIGEFDRLLRSWFGHETHISGEIFHTANGIAIAARAGGAPPQTFEGSEAELETLLGKAAEAVYGATQPIRYADYLRGEGRYGEAIPVLRRVIYAPSKAERVWAYSGWAYVLYKQGNYAAAREKLDIALRLEPDFWLTNGQMGDVMQRLGDEETALFYWRKSLAGRKTGDDDDSRLLIERALTGAIVDEKLGDYQSAFQAAARLADHSPDFSVASTGARYAAYEAAYNHDPAASRQWQAQGDNEPKHLLRLEYWRLAAVDDWAHAADVMNQANTVAAKAGDDTAALNYWHALEAEAKARAGRFAAAHALLNLTPLSCDRCVLARGELAASEHDWHAADYWFAGAVRREPSIPLAYDRWGRMLFAKGDLDGAIAKFKFAHEKGPHFADPLEMWGEVLMAQNRSDRALAKFTAAARYAPNWGRLHLKWGEALYWAGRKDEAKKQFVIAARLELSTTERRALSLWEKGFG